jgi:hypothetical protein
MTNLFEWTLTYNMGYYGFEYDMQHYYIRIENHFEPLGFEFNL